MSTPHISNSDGGNGGSNESRVRCLYCGANNFATSPACWQCSRPLQPLRTQQPAPAPDPSPTGSPYPVPTPGGGASYSGYRPPAAAAVDRGLATKSAALLGLMFPFFALPVGMVFLMLDDARKTQIGWITIGWSIVGSVLNGIALLIFLGPAFAALKALIPHSAHGGLPGLPGLPPMGGDDSDLNILIPIVSILLIHLP